MNQNNKNNLFIFLVLCLLLAQASSVCAADNYVTNMIGATKSQLYSANPSLREKCDYDDTHCDVSEVVYHEPGSSNTLSIDIVAAFAYPNYWSIESIYMKIHIVELHILGYPLNSTGAGDFAEEIFGLRQENRLKISSSMDRTFYYVYPSSRVACKVLTYSDLISWYVGCTYPYTEFYELEDASIIMY